MTLLDRHQPAARLAIAVILVLTAALYLHRLSDVPVYVSTDEAKLAAQAHSLATTGRDMRGNLLPVFVLIVDPLLPEQHSVAWWQPALFYTTAIVYRLAGVSVWSTRLPVVMLSVLNVWLIYRVASRWLRDRWVGVFAAGALALTPAHFILGREAADYFCPTTVSLVWLLCLGRLFESPSPRRAALTGMVLGLGLYSYITSWVVMPIYLLLTLAAGWRQQLSVRLLSIVAGTFAVCAMPAITFAVLHPAMFGETAAHYHVGGGLRFLERVTLFWDYFSPSYLFFAGGSSLMWSTREAGVFPLAMIVLLPLGAWVIAKREASIFGTVIVVAFILVPLPIVAALPEAPFYATARAILAAPLGALIAAASIRWLLALKTRYALAAGMCLTIAIPMQFAGFGRDYFGDYSTRSAPWIDAYNFKGVADRVIAIDQVRPVPGVFLSHDDIGEDKAIKWRFHLLAGGRMDLWDRSKYLMPEEAATARASGSVLVISAKNPRLPELQHDGWTHAATIEDAAGNPATAILQRP